MPPTATDKVAGEAESVKLGGSAAVTVTSTVVVALNEPDVPVMVTDVGPTIAAEDVAVKVTTSVPDVLPAVKAAVTPDGNPDVVYVTVALNPPTALTVIVLVTEPLSGTDTLVGEAESVKLWGTVTVTPRVVVSVSEPEVPVMVAVTALEVIAADEVAVSVTTSVPEVPAAKLAVTPLGRPDAVKVTAPVNPSTGVIVMVLVAVPPWVIDTLVGESESVKVGAENAVV